MFVHMRGKNTWFKICKNSGFNKVKLFIVGISENAQAG
jgi:hypothetical protein